MSSDLYVTVITGFDSRCKAKKSDFLQKKYVEEGLSLRQIAAEEMSSKETVRSALKKAGVKMRERGHRHGHPSQLKYGIKRKGQG